MKKDYVKPIVDLCKFDVYKDFALLSSPAGALDWSNGDSSTWDNFFD